MPADLPQVIEFNHAYDVRVETSDTGMTRVVARIKPSKYRQNYKRFHDLPFVGYDAANTRYHWWRFAPSQNYKEQQERADYFWAEFIRYVRGPQKKRRADAIFYTRSLLREIFTYRELETERDRFLEHLTEALIAHLRYGLDEGMSDAKLNAASEVAA